MSTTPDKNVLNSDHHNTRAKETVLRNGHTKDNSGACSSKLGSYALVYEVE
jgi:hypothetical protein